MGGLAAAAPPAPLKVPIYHRRHPRRKPARSCRAPAAHSPLPDAGVRRMGRFWAAGDGSMNLRSLPAATMRYGPPTEALQMPRGRSVCDRPWIARCWASDGRCGALRAARSPEHGLSRARDARLSGGVSHGIKRPRSPRGPRPDRAGRRSRQTRALLDPPYTQPRLESPDTSPALVAFLGDQAAGAAPVRKARPRCGQKRV